MKTRIITGIVAIALFVPVCIFSNYIVFPIVMAILSVIGAYEMAKCLKQEKKYALTIPMYIVAALLPISRFFFVRQARFFAFAMIVVFFMLIYALAYVMLRKNKDNLSEVLTLYALFVYIVGCFSSIVCVRYMPNGKYLYLLIFLGAWVCDTFAYFTGRFFGKHKLIPEISPKKTVEGSIGGIVFTVASFALYGLILDLGWDVQISYVLLLITGLIASVVSQIGDLVASSVKRQYNLKDYGNLFPGHGGVLDRFDSVMLTAPTLVILNLVMGYFNV